MKLLWVAAMGLMTACVGATDDHWRYGGVLWEREPAIHSDGDARARYDQISSQQELALGECYTMAVHRSESLAIDGEELVRLQAKYEQIFGAVLPYVSFKGSYTRQEDMGSSSSGSNQGFSTQKERTEYKFSVRQPLFSGLKEFYALRQSSALYGAKEHRLRYARLLLYGDVASAFYSVLQAERELATVRESLKLAQERLEELIERQQVGMSRRSEVLAQEAEVASTEARIEQLKGAQTVTWEALKFITGLTETRKLTDAVSPADELPPVESLIEQARARRPDIQALQAEVKAAEEGPGIARASYLPTAALEGNYFTHREGAAADIDWDMLLSVEVPLFEGRVTQARLSEAYSLIRSARLQQDRLERNVTLEVNRATSDVQSLHSEMAALEKAVSSAQENYEIVQAEYRQGIVTNIEVLTAFNTLEQARLGLDRARYQWKLAGVQLDISTGTLPGEKP